MAFDGNTWYQITETRVNFTYALFYDGTNDLYFDAADDSAQAMHWQLFQDDNGNFQFRNRNTGTSQQLGVCYVSDEASDSKTQPCMIPADESEGQRWSMSKWTADGGYKITNIQNGTGVNLDWHVGGPGFMSPTTAESPVQLAQHWLFSSIGLVNDDTYSTSAPTVAASTTASPTNSPIASSSASGSSSISTTAPVPGGLNSATSASIATTTGLPTANSQKSTSNSGLSSGAAAAVGVIVTLVVIALAGLAYILFMRRRKQKQSQNVELTAAGLPRSDNHDPYAGSKESAPSYPNAVYEAPGTNTSKLPPQYTNQGSTPLYEAPGTNVKPAEAYSHSLPAEMDAGIPKSGQQLETWSEHDMTKARSLI